MRILNKNILGFGKQRIALLISVVSMLTTGLTTGPALAANGGNFSASALTEFETSLFRDDSGSTTTEPDLSNVELSFDASIGANMGASLLLKKESGLPLEIDEAYAHYKWNNRSPLTVIAGQAYVPFGSFESDLISDPLTLETAETRGRVVMLGWDKGDISSALYLGGDSDITGLPGYYGFQATYNQGEDWLGRNIGLSYISHFGAATGVRDSLTNPSQPNHLVPAVGISGSVGNGHIRLVGEYIRAMEKFAASDLAFAGNGAAPSAYGVEIGWKTRVFKLPVNTSIAYQGSAEAFALGLPQSRLLAGVSTSLNKNTSLSFEWSNDRDYETTVGGTGSNSNTYSMLLSLELQ